MTIIRFICLIAVIFGFIMGRLARREKDKMIKTIMDGLNNSDNITYDEYINKKFKDKKSDEK